MATAMLLLLLQPFLVPCSSSTILLSIASSFNLLGFFKLFLPDNSCPHPSTTTPETSLLLSLLTLLISVLPDPYGSISSQSNFSQCFHHSLPLPLVSADRARRAGHLLSQTSCLPPSSTPLLGFPLLPPCSTQGRAELSQGEFWPKNQPQPCSNFPVQTAGAELAPLKAALGKPKSILFRQTDLPSIMKLPHSLICDHQQCWQCQEQQPPRWEPAQCR